MSWENRDYNRAGGGGYGGGGGGYEGGGMLQRLGQILNMSFPVGTYLGINVRVHIWFIIFGVAQVIDFQNALWNIRWFALLFGSVLLHEFGHALACRKVGGTANEILLWPLGGLAYCAPPRRPWPEFVTVIWGPLVNVIIAGACYAALFVMSGDAPDVFNIWADFTGGITGLIIDLFVVNVALVLFNMLLVFYPFDGGRIVQTILWAWLGYERSMTIAVRIGMGGAILIGLIGLAFLNLMLMLIGVFGFYTCYQQSKMLRYEGYGDTGMGGGYGYGYQPGPSGGGREPGRVAQWREKRQEAKREREAERTRHRDGEVDRVLDKVRQSGMHSLTEKEKRILSDATDRQRKSG